MAESMTLEEALVVSDQASPMPARAHLALQVLRAEVERLEALKEPSREERMVVIRRRGDGIPSVWCDPEIVDLVAALNAGGVPTVASCSGHGHRPGSIALADGRWLVVAKDDEERRKIDALFPVDINGVAAAGEIKPVAEYEKTIAKMVDRFLGWPLPSDFYPDGGITFTPSPHPHGWPSGTNLLNAEQARAMFDYCAAGLAPAAPSQPTVQTLRVTRERRAVLAFRLLDGGLLEIPEDSYCVELRNAAGPTNAYYPAKCSGRDPSPGPDLCKKLLPGDDVVFKLTTGLQEAPLP